MQAMKISVTGNTAAVTRLVSVTAGTVGMPVEFTFDESWAGLTKTAVFRAGNQMLDRTGLDSQTTVPWELLRKPGCHLFAGVYGYNADGSLQIPTVWADLGVILPGADPAGEESADPSVPIWKQLQDRAQDMENALNGQQQEIAAMEQEVSGHSQTLQSHTEILAKQGFVKLAETVLTEDATEIVWTQGANGEKLSHYKDFFIYWTGKFTADSAANHATNSRFQCRGNGGIMYFGCYFPKKSSTENYAGWFFIEEVTNDGNFALWKSQFPSEFLRTGNGANIAYKVQGLPEACRTTVTDICCITNPAHTTLQKLQLGNIPESASIFAAGTKAILYGRARQ